MRNEINKLNADDSASRIKIEEVTAREEKTLHERKRTHDELPDAKEALLTEIALMTDKTNDYEDVVQSLNENASKLTENN